MTRAQRSFWILTALTVLAVGLIAQGLAAPAGVGADILVAASTILLIISATLMVRVFAHLTRARFVVRTNRRG